MSESIVPDPAEHLTNGWEPEAPADDTLVRMAALVLASWSVEVAQALGRPWRRTDQWAGARVADRGELTNPVIVLQPEIDPGALVGEVEEILPSPTPYFLLSPWLSVDLSRHGLACLGHPPVMVRLPLNPSPPTPEGTVVREVTDSAELATAERVLVEGYPFPELQPLRAGELLAPAILNGPTRVWLGYVEGEPASVAAAHTHAGATLVEYVATLPSARGRGAGAAVTLAATMADPEVPAVLVASDDGRPVYERMGYVAIERWTAWVRPGG